MTSLEQNLNFISMQKSKGFTLVEILVAVAISGIVFLVAITLLSTSAERFQRSAQSAETREVSSALATQLTRVFSASQGIISKTTNISTNIAVNAPGELREGPWTNISSNPPGSWVPIALFRRDSGKGTTAASRTTVFQPTSIFYILPTTTKSGVLFINMGGSANMTPSWGDLYFDHITELTIDAVQKANIKGIDYVKSFRMTIKTRSFVTANKNQWRWCPENDVKNGMAGCNGASFKDYKTEIYVGMPNQILAAPDITTNNLKTVIRLMGSIYLFPIFN